MSKKLDNTAAEMRDLFEYEQKELRVASEILDNAKAEMVNLFKDEFKKELMVELKNGFLNEIKECVIETIKTSSKKEKLGKKIYKKLSKIEKKLDMIYNKMYPPKIDLGEGIQCGTIIKQK